MYVTLAYHKIWIWIFTVRFRASCILYFINSFSVYMLSNSFP